jgi:phosphoenolpyruvate-protein kinase (PTS system EI component)
VLRALARISDAGKRHGIEVSICGDMGRDFAYLSFFLGIGLRRFSVDPHFLAFMRDAVATIDIPSAEAFAARLLAARRIDEIEGLIVDWTSHRPSGA